MKLGNRTSAVIHLYTRYEDENISWVNIIFKIMMVGVCVCDSKVIGLPPSLYWLWTLQSSEKRPQSGKCNATASTSLEIKTMIGSNFELGSIFSSSIDVPVWANLIVLNILLTKTKLNRYHCKWEWIHHISVKIFAWYTSSYDVLFSTFEWRSTKAETIRWDILPK